MKSTTTPKFLILLICFLAFSFSTAANETIRFTGTNHSYAGMFRINATNGKQFTVDWGDGSDIETITGTGINYQEIKHFYTTIDEYTVIITGTTSDCLITSFSVKMFLGGGYFITSIDVSKATSLQILGFGDGSITSLDLSNNLALTNLSCVNVNFNALDLSNNTALTSLSLPGAQLSSLDLSNNPALHYVNCDDNQLDGLNLANNYSGSLYCQNNRLRLSAINEIILKIDADFEYDYIEFCEQQLLSQKIEVGESIDYSSEKEFGGVATIFTIKKDGLPAPESDYTVYEGIITFNTKGNYQISMTNSKINSWWSYNACLPRVIVDIEVISVNVEEITKEEIRINIYPNPTTGELTIKNEELIIKNIEIFDVYGRKQKAESKKQDVLDTSHLQIGVYFIKIITDKGEIVKKVMKQ